MQFYRLKFYSNIRLKATRDEIKETKGTVAYINYKGVKIYKSPHSRRKDFADSLCVGWCMRGLWPTTSLVCEKSSESGICSSRSIPAIVQLTSDRIASPKHCVLFFFFTFLLDFPLICISKKIFSLFIFYYDGFPIPLRVNGVRMIGDLLSTVAVIASNRRQLAYAGLFSTRRGKRQ